MNNLSDIIIYQAENGTTNLDVHLDQETVWLPLRQLTVLFGRDKSVISRHLRNVFLERELPREAVAANFATTADDGKTYQVSITASTSSSPSATGSNPSRGSACRICGRPWSCWPAP